MITMTASQHTTCTPPATIGASLRASRRAAAALWHVHREQTLAWELWWQASRATVPSTGPLRWVLTPTGTGWPAATCPPRITPMPGTPHSR